MATAARATHTPDIGRWLSHLQATCWYWETKYLRFWLPSPASDSFPKTLPKSPSLASPMSGGKNNIHTSKPAQTVRSAASGQTTGCERETAGGGVSCTTGFPAGNGIVPPEISTAPSLLQGRWPRAFKSPSNYLC